MNGIPRYTNLILTANSQEVPTGIDLCSHWLMAQRDIVSSEMNLKTKSWTIKFVVEKIKKENSTAIAENRKLFKWKEINSLSKTNWEK